MAVLAAAALAVTGCAAGGPRAGRRAAGSTDSAQVPSHGPQVVARPLAPFGTVLTTRRGYALYVFEPDAARRVTCSGSCATAWPPLQLRGSLSDVAGTGVHPSLLGTDRDSAGEPVITYAGWPLYTYAGDSAPGYATGQALNSDGGLWYLISAAGKVVKAGG